MPSFRELRPAAFRIRTDRPWTRKLYLMRFPEAWKTPLLSLSAPRRDGGTERSLPIRVLNSALGCLIPDVILPATRATLGDRSPWIYADAPVDPEALFAIVSTWVRHQSTDAAQVRSVLAAMRPDQLQWEPIEVDFAAIGRGQTRHPQRGGDDAHRLLPHVLAADLAAPDAVHEHLVGGTDDVHAISRFRRVPHAGSGAGVMSWPPHHAPKKPFSFTLGITTQSRAFTTAPLVHLGIGTRRWAHTSVKLSGEHNHTLYLLPTVPWIDGVAHSHSFLAASIRRHRSTTDDGETVWSATWAEAQLGAILRDLGCDARLPDLGALTRDPTRWFDQPDSAALVFRNGMYSFDHPVAPGTSLQDKAPLLHFAEHAWAAHLEPVPPLRGLKTTVLDHTTLKSEHFEHRGVDPALRRAVAETIGSELHVSLYWEHRSTRDYALSTLAELLAVQIPATGLDEPITLTLPTPDLKIILEVRAVGAWGGDLHPEPSIRNRRERLRLSIEDRIRDIADDLTPPGAPGIALVEIKDKDAYTGRRRPLDPKFAIKTGVNRRGYLTQCVTHAPLPTPDTEGNLPTSDSSLEKLGNCWVDLMRQLGVRHQSLPEPARTTSLAEPPAYLAFWLVRQHQHRSRGGATRQVPVAVLIDPTGHTIHACAPDVDWMPLHRAQRAISNTHMLTDQIRDAATITRFYSETLTGISGHYPSTLLLTCAQNLRAYWPNLANTRLSPDTIAFGNTSSPVTAYPGLRHVHVRHSGDDEVPECFGVTETSTGHPQGLWQADERVFFSTGAKPHIARGTSKSASKIVPYLNSHGRLKNPSPKARVWNARAVELTTAALQPGDTPCEWAALTHDLRWAAPHYTGTITLPWPLDVAAQIGEYILPIDLLNDLDATLDDTTNY